MLIAAGEGAGATQNLHGSELAASFRMANRKLNEGPGPQAKRTGREAPDPKSEPGEFADDMRVNRFTPPPDPEGTEKHRKE
jgi:hypothetical protein